ncbi:MAG: peptide chain release factor N(5)-glutamine methyltransferase [Boseongicola sp.]|nr:MAG: peptide chain release factor N(5)-glutamine methyltransferase [Boseongicola sp.]
MLSRNGVSDAVRDARRLLAFAMGVDIDRITLMLRDDVGGVVAKLFDELIQRRANREPVSHIIGGRWFRDHWFRVSADVLDPRPETEMLVDIALERSVERCLDLGTGSGCILLSILAEAKGATGIGCDASDGALRCAQTNTDALGMGSRVSFVKSNWWSGLSGAFDLIVSNPPYIALDEMDALQPEVREFEPRGALTDEGDGTSAYIEIARRAREFLHPDGRLIVEIGKTQASAVSQIFRSEGLEDIQTYTDLNGHDRVVACSVKVNGK